MEISDKNFIASQALYGLMISRPHLKDKKLVKRAYKLAKRMVKKGKKH